MSGSTYRRCACRDADGRQLGSTCPKLGRKGHGSWYYSVSVTAEGKRRQHKRGGFPTKTKAEDALTAVLADIVDGRYRDDGRRTVAGYLTEWVGHKATDGLRATTARSYRQHIDAYLIPALGHLRLRELRPAHVSRMLRDVSTGGELGAATVRRIHATLRSALSDARREGLVKLNAASDATVPRAERAKVQPWEPSELGRFLDYSAGDRLGPLFELTALTGLRRGEVCGLRWSDVDPAAGWLTIRQQLVQVDGQTHRCKVCNGGHRGVAFSRPKTASGDARRVDLGERGVGVLLAAQLHQEAERAAWGAAYADHGLVFAREDGNPLAPDQVTKVFGRLVKEAGLRHARIHDLRHGRASMLLASGADLAVVSKMLGHSTYTLTADTYSHLLEGVGRRASDAADALLPPRRSHIVPTTAQVDRAFSPADGANHP